MIFNYPKANKITAVLNDLLKINNDRIALYQKTVDQTGNIDSYLQDVFSNIITEAICFRQQILQKIKQLDGNVKNNSTLFGKVYSAWFDLKVAFVYNTQKTIIASYLYNEDVALHIYNVALNMHADMPAEVHQLIEKQRSALQENYDTIKKYRETSRTMSFSLLHF